MCIIVVCVCGEGATNGGTLHPILETPPSPLSLSHLTLPLRNTGNSPKDPSAANTLEETL